jgi:hypothetical protein
VTGTTAPWLLMASMQFFSILGGTGWISRKRELVPGACHTVARRSDEAVNCHIRIE